jgi:hypothetical protein
MDRDALIAAMRQTAAFKPKAVQVDGWGTVYVRALTVAEFDEQVQQAASGTEKDRLAKGAARILCDETGARLFDPSSPDDVALLAAQPWPLLRQLNKAFEEQNAATEEVREALGKA